MSVLFFLSSETNTVENNQVLSSQPIETETKINTSATVDSNISVTTKIDSHVDTELTEIITELKPHLYHEDSIVEARIISGMYAFCEKDSASEIKTQEKMEYLEGGTKMFMPYLRTIMGQVVI